MLLLPIKHENMAARRWPVITLSLIAINTLVFLFTTFATKDTSEQRGELRVDILILAATHPELKMHPEEQRLVDAFKKHNSKAWAEVQNPHRQAINEYDAKIKTLTDPDELQSEMDRLNTEY